MCVCVCLCVRAHCLRTPLYALCGVTVGRLVEGRSLKTWSAELNVESGDGAPKAYVCCVCVCVCVRKLCTCVCTRVRCVTFV